MTPADHGPGGRRSPRATTASLSINVAPGADVDEVHDALDAVVEDLPIVTVQDKEGFADLIKQQVNQLLS